MGLRSLEDGYVPPILDVSKLDRKVLVSNAESVAAVHALLDREGIFAGVSAGAVVHVARKLAAELDEGVVVCVLADAGWKYLSADFWESRRRRDVDGAHALVVVPAERARRDRRRTRGTKRRTKRAACSSSTATSPSEYVRGTNATPSPYRFELDVDPELWCLDRRPRPELAVFHSHLSSPPRPSRTDVENIGLWEGKPYLIYSLREDALAAWTIAAARSAARPDVAARVTWRERLATFLASGA